MSLWSYIVKFIGKIQFHNFSLEAKKYSNSKVSDKIKKFTNTLIILNNSSISWRCHSLLKKDLEPYAIHHKLIKCIPIYLKSA